jgi:NAD(P)H dehydrogenase (quinone)
MRKFRHEDSMNNGKILVTGATGQLGTRIVQHLGKKALPGQVVASGRNVVKAPQRVPFRVVDYDHPATIEAALEGVTRVVLVSGNEVGQRVRQHKAVIDAAARAGVQLLAYTSILKADASPLLLAAEHRGTEEVLRAGKTPFILLRNGWYSENFANSASLAIQLGFVQSAAREGRFSTASRDDYAEAAAALILREDHQPGQAYELAGSNSFSKREYAALLSGKSGSEVELRDLGEAQYAAALVKAGLAEDFARILADSDARAADGWLFDESRTLEKIIGRPTTPLEQSLDVALDVK